MSTTGQRDFLKFSRNPCCLLSLLFPFAKGTGLELDQLLHPTLPPLQEKKTLMARKDLRDPGHIMDCRGGLCVRVQSQTLAFLGPSAPCRPLGNALPSLSCMAVVQGQYIDLAH